MQNRQLRFKVHAMEHLRVKRTKMRQRLRYKFAKNKGEFIEMDDEFVNETSSFDKNIQPIELQKSRPQKRDCVVTILLVKAKNLPLSTDSREFTDAHLKFKLGNEKYKSKSTWTERWHEQFDLHLFDENQNLELGLWNRNTLYGKSTINLSDFKRQTTHGIWKAFDDCPGEVFLMLTISGTTALETINDLKDYKEDPIEMKLLVERYRWHRSLQNLRDVGHLTVKVFSATGLAASEIVLKSNPFCVLELGNSRLQTQTEHRTLTPNWNKIFNFNVKDITQCLEITVYDEDRDYRARFLGKVMIPLLRIRNGAKRWYALKNKSLTAHAKGNSPQILLEMTFVWSELRALYRTLRPKEEKLIQEEVKFKPQLFLRNTLRLRMVLVDIFGVIRYVQSCFDWKSPFRSVIALTLWILICLYGDWETIPLMLLLIILKNWSIKSNNSTTGFHYNDFDEDEDEEKETEEKKSLRERWQSLQEASKTVQNGFGKLASLAERIVNIFNFSIPFLTWLAAVLFVVAFIILHFIPMRFVLLFLGLIQFLRPLVHPNRIPKLHSFISRVPDKVELNQYFELQPSPKK